MRTSGRLTLYWSGNDAPQWRTVPWQWGLGRREHVDNGFSVHLAHSFAANPARHGGAQASGSLSEPAGRGTAVRTILSFSTQFQAQPTSATLVLKTKEREPQCLHSNIVE